VPHVLTMFGCMMLCEEVSSIEFGLAPINMEFFGKLGRQSSKSACRSLWIVSVRPYRLQDLRRLYYQFSMTCEVAGGLIRLSRCGWDKPPCHCERDPPIQLPMRPRRPIS
jgi:hypothetical protein